MWLTTYYILILLSITYAKISVFPEDENALNRCVIKILNEIQRDDPALDVNLIDSTNILHKELNGAGHFRIISRSLNWTNDTMPNRVFVIYSNNTKELKDGVACLKNDYYWNQRGIFIIHIQDTYSDLNEVSDFLRHENMFNVSVIIKGNGTDDNAYNIHGFTSDIDACHRPKEGSFKFLASCSRFDRTNIFLLQIPETMRDCRFKIWARDEWPYIRYPKISGRGIGIDQYVFDMWATKKNVSAETVVFNKKYDVDYILNNSYFKNYFDTFDAITGGHTLRYIRTRVLDYSYPYLVDHNSIIVARSPLIGKWEAIKKQFTYTVIFLISALFVIFCVIATYFSIFQSKLKDVIRDIFIVYGYFVSNTGANRLNSQFSARIILLSLFLFVFLLSNIIQAFLLSASTHPIRDYQETESHEIIGKFKPVIYAHWLSSFNFTDAKICFSLYDCVLEVVEGKNTFSAIPKTYHDLFSWSMLDDQGQMSTLKIPETLLFLFRVTYFQRGSTLLKPYNNHLLRMMSGGLVNFHTKQLENQARLRSKVKELPAFTSSKLRDFKEAFIVLLVGYSISIFVFVYELKFRRNTL